MEGLGKKIRMLRRMRDKSQRDIARACGVSFDTYRRWEKGLQEPRATMLCRLARLFGVTVLEVLDGYREEDTEASADTTGGR